MYSFILTIHIIVCFLMVITILFQAGRSGGFQGIFGSSGEVIFSTPSGSSFLRKLTIGCGVAFGVTSLVLTVMTRARISQSVTLEYPIQTSPPPQPTQNAPAKPAQK